MFRRIALATVPRAAAFAPAALLAPVTQHAGFFFPGPLFDMPDPWPRYGPPLQVSEEGDKVLVELDVPRYRPKDIELNVDKERGVVNVKGKRVNAEGELQSEFHRSFNVPPELDINSVDIKVEDGVACISIKRLPDQEEETSSQTKKEAIASDESSETTKNSSEAKAGETTDAAKTDDAVAKTTQESQAPAVKDDGYAAVRKMQWPPQMESKHDKQQLVYTCALPSEVKPGNIDIRLERDCVSLGVRASIDSKRKDSKGNVVYEDSRSVFYSTALPVPRDTKPDDVSVTLKDGQLSIAVRRHTKSETANSIKVSDA